MRSMAQYMSMVLDSAVRACSRLRYLQRLFNYCFCIRIEYSEGCICISYNDGGPLCSRTSQTSCSPTRNTTSLGHGPSATTALKKLRVVLPMELTYGYRVCSMARSCAVPTPMPGLNPLIPGTLRKFQGCMLSLPRLTWHSPLAASLTWPKV